MKNPTDLTNNRAIPIDLQRETLKLHFRFWGSQFRCCSQLRLAATGNTVLGNPNYVRSPLMRSFDSFRHPVTVRIPLHYAIAASLSAQMCDSDMRRCSLSFSLWRSSIMESLGPDIWGGQFIQWSTGNLGLPHLPLLINTLLRCLLFFILTFISLSFSCTLSPFLPHKQV